MDLTLLVPLGLVAVAAMFFINTYNGLIAKKNQVENVFSSVDVILKKRHDLIPNLIGAVKAYMQHEAETLTKIVELRSKATNPDLSDDEKVEVERELSGSLGRLMVAVENYPDLKANQNFLQLQAALNEVEEQLSGARRAFNSAVTAYNNALEMFPSNMIAGMMGLKLKEWFEVEEVERANVNVAAAFGV